MKVLVESDCRIKFTHIMTLPSSLYVAVGPTQRFCCGLHSKIFFSVRLRFFDRCDFLVTNLESYYAVSTLFPLMPSFLMWCDTNSTNFTTFGVICRNLEAKCASSLTVLYLRGSLEGGLFLAVYLYTFVCRCKMAWVMEFLYNLRYHNF